MKRYRCDVCEPGGSGCVLVMPDTADTPTLCPVGLHRNEGGIGCPDWHFIGYESNETENYGGDKDE